MESNTIVMTTSRHEYMWTLAPVGGTFQGTALPTSGLKRRPRPTTSGIDASGIDLRSRTP